jgi:hypothetical protein
MLLNICQTLDNRAKTKNKGQRYSCGSLTFGDGGKTRTREGHLCNNAKGFIILGL